MRALPVMPGKAAREPAGDPIRAEPVARLQLVEDLDEHAAPAARPLGQRPVEVPQDDAR
jgi:hypothetical protein